MRITCLLLSVALAMPLSPQGIIMIAKKKVVGYLLSETFDGSTLCATSYTSTCDNTWTVSAGTPDFDNSTSPAPLSGTYSLSLPAGATVYSAVSGHTGTAKIYVGLVLSPSGADATSILLRLGQSDGTAFSRITLLWSTDHFNVRLYHSADGTNVTYTSGINASEKWYLKIEYTPGTGANARYDVFCVQDSSGFPGWGTAIGTVTTASDTVTMGRITLYASAATTAHVVDNVRVSLSDITY